MTGSEQAPVPTPYEKQQPPKEQTMPEFDRGLHKATLDVWKNALVAQAVARRGHGDARHADGVEQVSYDALIDFIWENGLNFTEFDPRGIKNFDRDEYERLSTAWQNALAERVATEGDPDAGANVSVASQAEEDPHEALVKFVEANGLTGTELDPRDPRDEGDDL